MGYTHYWQQSRSIEHCEWDQVRRFAGDLLDEAQAAGIEMVLESDNEPAVTGRDLHVGSPDGESFILERKMGASFNWCKTRKADYDVVVVAILLGVQALVPDAIAFSSDGDPEYLEPGRRWAHRVMSGLYPDIAPRLEAPVPCPA